jgi:hypothetical protein
MPIGHRYPFRRAIPEIVDLLRALYRETIRCDGGLRAQAIRTPIYALHKEIKRIFFIYSPAAGTAIGAAPARVLATTSPNEPPHSPQNLSPGWLAITYFGHEANNGAPHRREFALLPIIAATLRTAHTLMSD